jgi:hypothetical protein
MAIVPFSLKLIVNHLPTEIQRLYCHVNFVMYINDNIWHCTCDLISLECIRWWDYCVSTTGFGLCIELIINDCICL